MFSVFQMLKETSTYVSRLIPYTYIMIYRFIICPGYFARLQYIADKRE